MSGVLQGVECRLHLVTGEVLSFRPDEPALVLEQVRGGKAFGEQTLVVACPMGLMAVPGDAVERIDFVSPGDAVQTPHIDVGTEEGALGQEIDAEDWHQRTRAMLRSFRDRTEALGAEGTPIETYGRLTLASGAVLHLAFRFTTPPDREQRRFLHRFFGLPSYPFHRKGEGFSVVHPSKIRHALFHPGAAPPANAWLTAGFDF